MIVGKLKNMFRTKDEKELSVVENDFDELMTKVDEDEMDLVKLEKHVRKEFDEIKEDIQSLGKDVDEVVDKKKPAKDK